MAPLLLGGLLTFNDVTIRLTEVEAYLGSDDAASHAFRGPSPRNSAMFGPPGTWYVYLSYGIHMVGNIVCSPTNVASGVLLRAGSVISGSSLASRRRNFTSFDNLARGPGNLGQALGLSLADNGSPVTFEPGKADSVCSGPRVGISKNASAPLRFWTSGEPSVSRRR